MAFRRTPTQTMTHRTPLASIDAYGTVIELGDRVQILVVPAWLTHDLPAEDQARLKATEGCIVSVTEIDRFGYLWFSPPADGFCLRPEEVRRV